MPMCTTGAGPAAALLGSSGPTVLLNANYLTDTILNDVSAPAGNLDALSSWATATGGTFTKALAVAAGASVVDGPFYVTASGVHTDGVNVALTAATPITIPADQDAIIYIKGVFPAANGRPIGSTTSSMIGLVTGDSIFIADVNGGAASLYISPPTGAALIRIRLIRSGTPACKMAWTGQAEATADDEGHVSSPAALSFDTLLASGSGGTLSNFAPTGMYIQKIKITIGSAEIDTAYETANGGVL